MSKFDQITRDLDKIPKNFKEELTEMNKTTL